MKFILKNQSILQQQQKTKTQNSGEQTKVIELERKRQIKFMTDMILLHSIFQPKCDVKGIYLLILTLKAEKRQKTCDTKGEPATQLPLVPIHVVNIAKGQQENLKPAMN